MPGELAPALVGRQPVEQHGKHPDLPRLQPEELVGVVDRAITREAGEIAAAFAVRRVSLPERDDVVEQRAAVLFREFGKVGFHGDALRENRVGSDNGPEAEIVAAEVTRLVASFGGWPACLPAFAGGLRRGRHRLPPSTKWIRLSRAVTRPCRRGRVACANGNWRRGRRRSRMFGRPAGRAGVQRWMCRPRFTSVHPSYLAGRSYEGG